MAPGFPADIHISQLVVDHVDASSITIPQVQLAGSALVLLYALLALLVLNLLAHIATSVMLLRHLRRQYSLLSCD